MRIKKYIKKYINVYCLNDKKKSNSYMRFQTYIECRDDIIIRTEFKLVVVIVTQHNIENHVH